MLCKLEGADMLAGEVPLRVAAWLQILQQRSKFALAPDYRHLRLVFPCSITQITSEILLLLREVNSAKHAYQACGTFYTVEKILKN